MKCHHLLCLGALFGSTAIMAHADDGPAAYHVSPSGNDTHPGSFERPFATIERAAEAVRTRRRQGLGKNLSVVLRRGVYQLGKTLELGPDDGGTPDISVTYMAHQGEDVTISGGRAITGWKRGDDGLWFADLPDVREGRWFFRQLYADGKRLPRGRFPAEGFLKIRSISKDYRKLEFTTPLPDRDFGGQDTEVVVVQNWSISRERITGSTASGITAETQVGWVGHMACLPKPGMSAFLEHSRSFIREAGQWFLDRKQGRLYYKAAEGENPNQLKFVAPVLDQLFRIEGTREQPVRNLEFRELHFEHTSFEMPTVGYAGIQACYHGTTTKDGKTFAPPVAIELVNAHGCRVTGCRVRRTGASGIGLGAGCRDNRIIGCELADIGGTGINLGHMPVKDPLWADWDAPQDAPANNEVSNCHIHHCGAELWGAHGIFDAMTRDTRIRHNEIAHLPYGGIATGYVWNTERTSQQGCLIEYNHVHEVMLKLNDSGCLYTLGFQPGSIIRNNLFHGVRFGGYAGGQVCNNGIFMDEGSKGFVIEGNVIYDIDQKPGAKNNPVRHNRNDPAWHTWTDNTFETSAEVPEAAKRLIDKAGLQPEYRHLLETE